MADTRSVRAGRLLVAARTGWVRTVAFLVPRCRRALAAARTGWVRTIAFLVPRCRRALAAARTGWVRTVAFAVPQGRRLAATARAALENARRRFDHRGDRRRHHRSGAADLGSRVSHIAKQSVARDVDDGEHVSLADLLDEDAPEPQYQR